MEESTLIKMFKSKLGKSPAGLLALPVQHLFGEQTDGLFNMLIESSLAWAFAAGWFVCCLIDDFISEKSFIKWVWHRIFIGISYEISIENIEIDEEKAGLSAKLVQNIYNSSKKRCEEGFELEAVISSKELKMRKIIKENIDCVSGEDLKRFEICDIFVSKDLKEFTFQPKDDSKTYNLPSDLEIDIQCSGKRTARSKLELKTDTNIIDLITLVGTRGEFVCQNCRSPSEWRTRRERRY